MILSLIGRLDAIQRRMLLLSGAVAAVLPAAQRWMTVELFDASPYYVFLGVSGPYAVLEQPHDDAPPRLGELQSQFRAGDWIGFKSNLTVEEGVGLAGTRIIVRVSDGVEVSREEKRLPPGERRQGEKDYLMHLPRDLRPGPYQLRIKATFTPLRKPPVAVDDFPTISFEVLAPAR